MVIERGKQAERGGVENKEGGEEHREEGRVYINVVGDEHICRGGRIAQTGGDGDM